MTVRQTRTSDVDTPIPQQGQGGQNGASEIVEPEIIEPEIVEPEIVDSDGVELLQEDDDFELGDTLDEEGTNAGITRRRTPRRNDIALPSSDELIKADAFTRYLAEIRQYPLLTREEEKDYAEAYYNDEDPEAAAELVTGNLRLVVKIALEYRRAWVNVMDLIQEGNIGLAEAVKRYDPYRGVRFSSFARYWIRALILQFILKNFRLVSFASTRAGRKLFFRLEKERQRLLQEHGEAGPKMLAEALDVSEADVELAQTMRMPSLSLTAPRSPDGESRPLHEVLSSGEESVEQQVAHSSMMAIVDKHMKAFYTTLTNERDQIIWTDRLLAEDPVALQVLGERFGVSRERVRQLEARLKGRLKTYLTEQLGADFQFDFNADD
ncbi:MAG: sigma-70 family RNA polymerase sigma factor [Bradymonadia bacterium]